MPAYSTARFYNFAGSLSSGEYPLLAENVDISEHLVATVQRVKHSKDIQQAIRVAMFEGYENVNMVELDGDYYWLVSHSELANGEVRYVLDFAAPTTLIRYHDHIRALWSKTPTRRCAYMHETISNDTMTVRSSTQIRTDREDNVYWVQVIGDDAQGHPVYRGFFAYMRDKDTMTPSSGIARYLMPTSQTPQPMPLLQLVIQDPAAYIGMLAQNIKDFSISAVCPYPYTLRQVGGLPTYDIYPSAAVQVSTSGSGYWAWDLTQLPQIKDPQTLEVDISDEDVNSLGLAVLRDECGNAIMNLQMQAADGLIRVRSKVVADTSGIYTVYEQLDGDGDAIQRISVPEGKVPYDSDTWATYKAYQMEGDRQAMQNSIGYADKQQEIDLLVGTTNAAVHGIEAALTGAAGSSLFNLGAPAVAGAAMGASISLLESGLAMWESNEASELKKQQARDDYALSMKRAIQQPQTAYNVPYGLIYVVNHNAAMPRVEVQMPENMTHDYYINWRHAFGYAAEGLLEVQAVPGYYQGKLLCDGSIAGQRFDELNSDFSKGFRFVMAGPPIHDAIMYDQILEETLHGVTWTESHLLKIDGVEFGTHIHRNPWAVNGEQGFINRSDMPKSVGIHWGQSTGTVALDRFGYCRYYYIQGRLFAESDFYSDPFYSEITDASIKAQIIAEYDPVLYPDDEELTDFMRTSAFHSLTIEEE